jgi:hypothetical protein
MSMPAPAEALTVQNLYHKIGVLSVNNEFLANEVERLNAWIRTHVLALEAEVTKLETEADVEEKTVADKIKAVISRVRAKL